MNPINAIIASISVLYALSALLLVVYSAGMVLIKGHPLPTSPAGYASVLTVLILSAIFMLALAAATWKSDTK